MKLSLGLGLLALTLFAGCKARPSDDNASSSKDISGITPAGVQNGQMMWTVQCAAGWVHGEPPCDKALIPASQLGPNIDKQICTTRGTPNCAGIPIVGGNGGNGGTTNNGGSSTNNGGTVPPNGAQVSLADCKLPGGQSSLPPEFNKLVFVVQAALDDPDFLCISFRDNFNVILQAPAILKFLAQSQPQPAKVFIGKAIENDAEAVNAVKYVKNLHRVLVPINFDANKHLDLFVQSMANEGVTDASLSPILNQAWLKAQRNGAVRMSTNGSQPIPLIMWNNEEHEVCETAPNINAIGQVICRQLGKTFQSAGQNVSEATDSLNNQHISLVCNGTENSIAQCTGQVVVPCEDNTNDASSINCQ